MKLDASDANEETLGLLQEVPRREPMNLVELQEHNPKLAAKLAPTLSHPLAALLRKKLKAKRREIEQGRIARKKAAQKTRAKNKAARKARKACR